MKDEVNKFEMLHWYAQIEKIQLQDQASTLIELLHSDTFFPARSKIIEAGCGVSAQTITLARNSPYAHIISFDISESSVGGEAKKKIKGARFKFGPCLLVLTLS